LAGVPGGGAGIGEAGARVPGAEARVPGVGTKAVLLGAECDHLAGEVLNSLQECGAVSFGSKKGIKKFNSLPSRLKYLR
jgi:hypothetical protein